MGVGVEDAWMLIFTGLGAFAAVGSAVVAIVQASGARASKKDAADARDEARQARDESERLAVEANEAFKRQAEAQEEANRLKLREMEPDDWVVEGRGGAKLTVRNTSGKTIVVESTEVQPELADRLLTIRTVHSDSRYEYGDFFDCFVTRTWGLSPEKLTVQYTREGDEPGQPRILIIPL